MSKDSAGQAGSVTEQTTSDENMPSLRRSIELRSRAVRGLLAEGQLDKAADGLRELDQQLSHASGLAEHAQYEQASFVLHGKLAEALQDLDQAIEFYRKALERNPKDSLTASTLARLEAQQDRFDLALDVLQRSCEANKDTKTRGYQSHEALLIKLRIHPCNRPVFKAPTPVAPDERALIVMIARDEDDVILASLHHHYSMGFRNFFILNNLSVDGTTDLIRYFTVAHPDALVMQVPDDAGGFYQREKTQALVDFARQYIRVAGRDPSWCFVLDADEFIDAPSPDAGIKGLLDQAEDYLAIGFNFCNATSEDGSSYDHFSRSVYDHFLLLQKPGNKPVSKMAFRLAIQPEVSLGNHRVFAPDLLPNRVLAASEKGYQMVHLPTRSIRQIMKKANRSAEVIKSEDVKAGRIWVGPTDTVMREGEEGARKLLAQYHAGIKRSND